MSTCGKKKFVMKHVYTNANNLEIGVPHEKEVEHFGIKWSVIFRRDPINFRLFLLSELDGFHGEWTMDATIDAKLKTITGEEIVVKKCKFSNETRYCYFKEKVPLTDYTVDNNFSVEFHVRINKMTGIEEIPEKKILRSFDESKKEFSDVVLVVKDQKFYVNKMYLASHSPYFNALLLGNFDESKQSEVELKDIEPSDFQNFLELIYGEPAVDGNTVEGLLKLADMYDCKTAFRRCEVFLLQRYPAPLKTKFRLATNYKLKSLMEQCLSEIKTASDIRSMIPKDIDTELLDTKLKMSTGGKKKFVMKHVYTDVNNLKIAELHQKKEDHFGLNWTVFFMRDRVDFWLGLRGEPDGSDGEWTMDVTIDAKLKTITGEEVIVEKCTYSNETSLGPFFKDEVPLNNYIVNGNFSVEFHVTINKMTGIEEIPKLILRRFDESAERFSDVVLVVKDQKFYVCKMYLASHSPYFNALLLGNFGESKQAEVELKDIEPSDFQNFLEVLHGEPVIQDSTIAGILELADMYDAKTAIRQCEEFFIHKSKQDMKVKFEAAAKYKMEKLLDKCISEIKTIADIQEVMPEDFTDFDPKIAGKLLKLSIDLYKEK